MENEIELKYKAELIKFEKVTQELLELLGEKKFKVSKRPEIVLGKVLLDRIWLSLKSYMRITPGSSLYNSVSEEWDIPSLASLTRNIIENFNVYYYLSAEVIDANERMLRVLICELHSEVERLKMFFELNVDQAIIDEQKLKADKIRKEIIANTYFGSFDEMKKNDILKGNKAYYLSHKEITRRVKLGIEEKEVEFIYRYTSNFIHTSPFSMAQAQQNVEENREEAIETVMQLLKITSLFIENILKMAGKIMK